MAMSLSSNLSLIETSLMGSVSKKSVIQKLGIKAGESLCLVNNPIKLDIPKNRDMRKTLRGKLDCIIFFANTEADLKKQYKSFKHSLSPKGKVWVAWKKGHVSDLNRDSLATNLEKLDLIAVSSISVNDEWSALKFMHPKDQRT